MPFRNEKIIKYLGINLTKEVKDAEPYKTLMKKLKKTHMNRPYSQIGRINMVKMYYPEQPIDSMKSLSQCQWHS